MALGLGIDGVPTLLLCTSGTAAANFYPAVVEAGLSEVPMIVLTADRPDELRGVGAPQTIDQIDLYGSHVRWSHDPGVPVETEATLWREVADDAWRHALLGPVQLNLAFREPLLGTAGPLPGTRVDTGPEPTGASTGRRSRRGVGGLGASSSSEGAAGSPRLTSPRCTTRPGGRSSPIRSRECATSTVRSAPPMRCSATSGSRRSMRPDVIVRIGRPAASKVLAQWTARLGAPLIQVGGPGVIDPDHNVTAVCTVDVLLQFVEERSEGTPADRR